MEKTQIRIKTAYAKIHKIYGGGKNIAIKKEETQERRKASTGRRGDTKKESKIRGKTVREKHKRGAKKI